MEVAGRKGTVTVDQDEDPSHFNEEKLRQLAPAFGQNGTVTAGNASSVNDGAAAVVVLSRAAAKELGVEPQARILGLCHRLARAGVVYLGSHRGRSNLLENSG